MNSVSTTIDEGKNSFQLSRTMAGVAVGLWGISLCLPGLVIYGNGVAYPGIYILLLGWAGIFGSSIGWYANVFWYWAIRGFWKTEKLDITTPAIFAAILSLDTFRVETISFGTEIVYGVGIGALVWVGAIFLTLLAVSVYKIEEIQYASPDRQQCNSFKERFVALFVVSKNTRHIWFLGFSSVLLLGYIALATETSTHDRVAGNADEQVILEHTKGGFKTSEICSETLKPTNQILINGPLELINPEYHKVISPAELLAMGIPVVREIPVKESWGWKDLDYFLTDKGNPKSLQTKPPEGEAVARLNITYFSAGGDHSPKMVPQYHITLISKQGVVGFDQVWKKQYMGIYCPNLYDDKLHYSLKKLINQTIVFPKAGAAV